MKIKKVLGLLTVMIAVFGFSTGAFAAWGDEICTTCKSCTVDNVACEAGEQEDILCYEFDYDNRYIADGYCVDSDAEKCRAIFNICNCENPEDFLSGQTIGVRMTVLVDGEDGENGAYWSGTADANVEMRQYGTEADACEDMADVYDKEFGPGKFYLSDLETEVPQATLVDNPTCEVVAAARATVILTDPIEGYTITPQDAIDKLSHWWIDVAPIRIDPNVLNNGELISVKIELLNQESGGICADCTCVCECIVDVAIVCCADDASYSMYFPYLVTQDAAWNTGIVVTNLGSSVAIADMEATFTLTDGTGAEFTYTKTDFETKVWAFVIDVELPNFSGTPLPGTAWLNVETNFSVDGWHFMTDGNFGAGSLPRLE